MITFTYKLLKQFKIAPKDINKTKINARSIIILIWSDPKSIIHSITDEMKTRKTVEMIITFYFL